MLHTYERVILTYYTILIFSFCTEASYAYELKKPYFPIVVQPGYKTSGWLGPMCAEMYKYNICRPDKCESETELLLQEIEKVVRNKTHDGGSGTNN